jgi:hypothetical protein
VRNVNTMPPVSLLAQNANPHIFSPQQQHNVTYAHKYYKDVHIARIQHIVHHVQMDIIVIQLQIYASHVQTNLVVFYA